MKKKNTRKSKNVRSQPYLWFLFGVVILLVGSLVFYFNNNLMGIAIGILGILIVLGFWTYLTVYHIIFKLVGNPMDYRGIDILARKSCA